MTKKVLVFTSFILLLFSCRQEDVLSNDDIANIKIIQTKRNMRNSFENKNNDSLKISNSDFLVTDTEPTKVPPKK